MTVSLPDLVERSSADNLVGLEAVQAEAAILRAISSATQKEKDARSTSTLHFISPFVRYALVISVHKRVMRAYFLLLCLQHVIGGSVTHLSNDGERQHIPGIIGRLQCLVAMYAALKLGFVALGALPDIIR